MSMAGGGVSAVASLGFTSRFVLNGILTHSAAAGASMAINMAGNMRSVPINVADSIEMTGAVSMVLHRYLGRLSGFLAEGFKCLLIIGMPARKRRGGFENGSRRPPDASAVGKG